MPIFLNHTIVPAHDHEASARFFAKIFGLAYDGPAGHFAPVVINDTLTLDFDNREGFESHHYAFHVTDEDFDPSSAGSRRRASNTAADPVRPTIWRSTPASAAEDSTSLTTMATTWS